MPESPHRSIGKIKSVLLFPGPEKEPLSTAQIQELQKTIQELNATVANLNETIAEFRRKFFGTSRESAAGRDPEEETGQEGQTEESTVRSHTRRKPKAKPEELYKNLPVGEVHCAMPEGQRLCPDYDAPMETIGWQFVREELRITPAKVERIQYLHEVLACPVCREEDTGTIVKAPVPTALLAHRPASPSMAAFVMYHKFLNSVPFYRQEMDYYQPGKPGNYAKNFLEGFFGLLECDGYTGSGFELIILIYFGSIKNLL